MRGRGRASSRNLPLREPRFSPAVAVGAKERAAGAGRAGSCSRRSLITPLPPLPDPRAGGTSEGLERNTGLVTAPARRRGSSRSVAELTAVGGSHQLLLLALRGCACFCHVGARALALLLDIACHAVRVRLAAGRRLSR